MKKYFFISFVLFVIPYFCYAQSEPPRDTIFKAKVTEITKEQETVFPDGTKKLQQNIKFVGLEGEYKGREMEFNGINDIDVVSKQIYHKGDKILVAESFDSDGGAYYYIVDFVRTGVLWWLFVIFMLELLLVGRLKGGRSLLALGLSFMVIIKFIIPRIITGANPLLITTIGSFFILLIIIYVTEGLKPRAHLSVISIFVSLMATIFISQLFVSLARLTGAASEEVLFLFNIGKQAINLKGLLLAGIIIGTLGILDDVVISQVATTEEIARTNKNFRIWSVYKRSYRIGVSHIASMTNTLFLAYAGVSLPLLILFVSGNSAFTSWTQALNTELISTEIIRTLAGSIGLVLSVPISTYVASKWYTRKNNT